MTEGGQDIGAFGRQCVNCSKVFNPDTGHHGDLKAMLLPAGCQSDVCEQSVNNRHHRGSLPHSGELSLQTPNISSVCRSVDLKPSLLSNLNSQHSGNDVSGVAVATGADLAPGSATSRSQRQMVAPSVGSHLTDMTSADSAGAGAGGFFTFHNRPVPPMEDTSVLDTLQRNHFLSRLPEVIGEFTYTQ